MVLDFFCHMWMSQVEKNEEKYEDESFGVGALTVGMQVKKSFSFLSILFFASTTMITPPPKKKQHLGYQKKSL